MRIIDEYRLVKLRDIELRYENPRKEFEDEGMQELINSVRESGVLNPIWCGEENGRLFLIAGERRLRAADEVNLEMIPAKIFQVNDEAEVRVLQMVENEQRADLSQKERYDQLSKMKKLGMSVNDMAKTTGLNATTIRGILDLEKLQEFIFDRTDIDDFAKTQIAQFEKGEQEIIAEKLASEEITARQLYEDVLRNLRRLHNEETLTEEQKRKIRSTVITEVRRDVRAERIISREKMIRRMRSKGEIPKLVDDALIERYVSESDRYYKILIEMLEVHVEIANPTLVTKLGLSITAVREIIDKLTGKIHHD